MNAEIKRKWVEALRSGEYQQGQLQRRTEDGRYCCLGVLWEVCGVDSWQVQGEWSKPVRRRGNDDTRYVPEEAGLLNYTYLMQMNDTGKPFSEIADYIEKNL